MNNRRNKKKGSKFEDKVKKTLNSGSLWMSPLDLSSKENQIEVKYTDKPGYRISLDLLNKIWGQSLSMNKEPYLIIGIPRDDEQMFVLHCQINIERRMRT
jgi:isochorismate hydrolase